MRGRFRPRWGLVVSALLLGGWLLHGRDGSVELQKQAREVEGEVERVAIEIPRPASTSRLSGRVATQRGELQGAARVCATCASCEITQTVVQFCVDTDAGGSYSIDDLSANRWRVTAAADGYALASAREGRPIYVADGAHVDDVDILLETPGEEVAGQVLDATGGPIAGAKVRLVSWGAFPRGTEVVSDREGTFRAYLAGGRVTATASADGYARARVHGLAPTRDLLVRLTPESSITGRVVTQDERPVSGATVTAIAERMGPAGAPQTVSAFDGRFELRGLEPGRFAVSASAPGYRSAGREVVELALGGAVHELLVRVIPAAQVRGRVLRSDGGPCEHGVVSLGPPHPAIGLRKASAERPTATPTLRPPAHLTVPIGVEGQVHFEAVPPGHYFVSVECEGHLQGDGPETLPVQAADVDGLIWRVVPSTRLTVRVVDQRGRPVPKARVGVRWPDTAEYSGVRSGYETDAHGVTPPITSLYPGLYTLYSRDGYEAAPVEVELEAGVPEVTATLVIQGSSSLELDVRDRRAQPVDGLRVSARSCAPTPEAAPLPESVPIAAESAQPATRPRALTATPLGLGRYRMAPLRGGCYRVDLADGINSDLSVSDEGGAIDIELADARDQSLRVVVDRGATLRGRVVSSSGEPLSDVWVSARAAGGDEKDVLRIAMQRQLMHATGRVLSDHRGEFAITALESGGSYDVIAEQPGGGSGVVRGVSPDAQVTVQIADTGTIQGLLTDARGTPVDRFTVQVVESETQRTLSREFTGAGGRFELGGVTPGQLEIRATDPVSGQVARVMADLKEGQRITGLQLALPH